MAEETKKQESKPETSKESVQTTESAAIKNKDAEKIQALQSENAKLKDQIGKRRKVNSLASKSNSSIVGFQGLRGFGRK